MHKRNKLQGGTHLGKYRHMMRQVSHPLFDVISGINLFAGEKQIMIKNQCLVQLLP